jgi:hypothetical protein
MKRMTQNEVIACSKARAIMETQLCTEMYGLYNGNAILGPIRSVVSLAIEQILALMQFNSVKGKVNWDAAIKKAGAHLAVWRLSGNAAKETAAGLAKVWESAAQWTADDCGDLIRLFGGLVEDTTLHGQAVDPSVNKARDDKRKFGFGKDERSRTTDGFSQSVAHIGQAHLSVLSAKRVQGGFSGIEKISLTEKSTVKKIDCAYGLAEGCDISGTTADSIFFFDHVNKFITGLPEAIPPDCLPVIQLFPMATMASQGHHTVLECALTLTQNELIKYRVGFYSTLMPEGSNNELLARLFRKYEHDPRNVHMLCWWDDNGTRLGGVRFDKPFEVQMLKQGSLADPQLLKDFKALGPKSSKAQILNMARYNTLGAILGIS